MSRFKPVYLPDYRGLNGRVSQTFLRHYNGCPRSGYLYALYKGEARTREMERGRGLHAIAERMTLAMMAADEPMIPGEIAKAIVNETLADPEFAIPLEEHDYLRECAYRLAGEWTIDPGAVIACESLFTMDVGGYQVRAKIDHAATIEADMAVYVADFKSSRSAPPFEDVARKRPDGTLSAKNFQLVLYALVLAFGVPVRVEECLTCEGEGQACEGFAIHADDPARIVICPTCRGRGEVEIPEPFPLASRAARFDLEFIYPGIEDRDGKMLRRPMSLTRAELDEYRLSLEGLLARVRHSEETGDWPAVASDAACAECPARSECPIPAELRDFRGVLNTMEEAAEAFEKAAVEKRLNAAMQKERRKFVEANGPVRFGGNMVAEIAHSTVESIRDKDAMFAAQDRAVLYGEPFERHRFVKVSESFRLAERELTADELIEAESEGSNGQDGRRRDGDDDDERRLDERVGADPPF